MALDQRQAIQQAIFEAQRFITKADAALAKNGEARWWVPSKENAAAKRASLDLTRALSEFRRAK